MTVVLHKPNGVIITYSHVTKVLVAMPGYISFTDETFGAIESTLPFQVKHNPVAAAAEKAQS